MLTLPLPTYGANLVANIGANGPLAVALGLCLLRRVDPGVLAAADATGTNKLLLAATTVAMKAHFDDFYVNKYMARIGGLETAKELGELEAHMFLTLLGGRAQVSPGEVGHRDRQQRDGSSSGSLQGIVQWREGVDSDATPLPEPGETPRSAAPPLVVADDHEQASRSPSPLPVPIAADVISQTPRHHRGPRRRAQRRLTVPAAEQRRLPLTQPSLLGTTPHEAPRPPLLNHGGSVNRPPSTPARHRSSAFPPVTQAHNTAAAAVALPVVPVAYFAHYYCYPCYAYGTYYAYYTY
jgi:hypothetical protein